MLVERAEGCAPEDVGVEPLLSVLVLEGLLPVERCELQDSADRPARQEAEEVAEIGVGLDVVELAARQQRDEGGVDLGGVVGTDDAAEINAAFVSLLASCQLHDIEPYAYLRDLFCLLPSWPVRRVLELAPLNWKKSLEDKNAQQRLDANVFRRASLGSLDQHPQTK